MTVYELIKRVYWILDEWIASSLGLDDYYGEDEDADDDEVMEDEDDEYDDMYKYHDHQA